LQIIFCYWSRWYTRHTTLTIPSHPMCNTSHIIKKKNWLSKLNWNYCGLSCTWQMGRI
jgi:hypothetical protein